MNILLIGPPGAGKGSQAKCLVSEQSFRHISTGDLFRRAIREKTPLGLKAREYMDRGNLVPDHITIALVEEALIDGSDNVVFDGFPRTAPQSEALEGLLQKKGRKLDCVLSLEVSDSVILERLTGRRWAPDSGRVYHLKHNPPKHPGKCDETGEALIVREDDRQEVVKTRLSVFRENTRPLLSFYESRGLLKKINGENPPEKVFQDILAVLR